MKKPKYTTETIQVPIGEEVHYIRFKCKKHFVPSIGWQPIEKVVGNEKKVLSEIEAEKAKNKPNEGKIKRLNKKLAFPKLISGYLESGVESSFFDIIEESEVAERGIKESKVQLKETAEKKDARIKELEAKLAELQKKEEVAETPPAAEETEEPKK